MSAATDLGQIAPTAVPAWPTATVGSVFDIQQGKALSAAARTASDRYPFLRTTNVMWNRIDLKSVDRMGMAATERQRLALAWGDLLVCEGGDIGRAAVWRGEIRDCFYQNHIHRLRARTDADPDFFAYWFRYAFTMTNLYQGAGTKTTIANLSRGRLASLPIPLPSLIDQRRIARILSAIQRAQTAALAQLHGAATLKRSVVAKAFAVDGYATMSCSDICDVLSVGIVVRPTQYYANDGVVALRSLNVREDEIDFVDTVHITPEAHRGPVAKSALHPGDVVIVRTGYPGTSAVIPEELTEANCIDLVFARPSRDMHPEYLSRFFNSPSGRAQALAAKTGMAQQHLNVGAVARMQVPVPPLDVQASVVGRLRTVDGAFKALRAEARSLDVLFDSALMHLMGAPT